MKKFILFFCAISLFVAHNSTAQLVSDLDTVYIGAAPNDGTGDPLRTAFDKLNDNDQKFNIQIPSAISDSIEDSEARMRVEIGDTADVIRGELADTAAALRAEIAALEPDTALFSYKSDSANHATNSDTSQVTEYAFFSGLPTLLNYTSHLYDSTLGMVLSLNNIDNTGLYIYDNSGEPTIGLGSGYPYDDWMILEMTPKYFTYNNSNGNYIHFEEELSEIKIKGDNDSTTLLQDTNKFIFICDSARITGKLNVLNGLNIRGNIDVNTLGGDVKIISNGQGTFEIGSDNGGERMEGMYFYVSNGLDTDSLDYAININGFSISEAGGGGIPKYVNINKDSARFTGNLESKKHLAQLESMDSTAVIAAIGVYYTFSKWREDTSVNVTVTDSTLTIVQAGFYEIDMNASYSGINNATVDVNLFVDDVMTPYGFERKLSTGGDVGNAGFICRKYLNQGDVLKIKIQSDATGTLTGRRAMFGITKIN